jgi:hypothetical protein
MGHANPSVSARYRHQLDHQYLDDARALSEYLRRADSPARIEQATTVDPLLTKEASNA